MIRAGNRAKGLLCVVVFLALAGTHGCREGGPPPGPEGARRAEDPQRVALAKKLFLESKRSRDRSYVERREAVARLARMPEGERWIIVTLLADWALCGEGELPPRDLLEEDETLADLQRSVIASALENVPPDAGDALLWAITEKLVDPRRGKYAQVEYDVDRLGPLTRRSSMGTRPVRDLAREALERALGVDHGYDRSRWRQQILDRETE